MPAGAPRAGHTGDPYLWTVMEESLDLPQDTPHPTGHAHTQRHSPAPAGLALLLSWGCRQPRCPGQGQAQRGSPPLTLAGTSAAAFPRGLLWAGWGPPPAAPQSQALGSLSILFLPVHRGQPSTAVHRPCLTTPACPVVFSEHFWPV